MAERPSTRTDGIDQQLRRKDIGPERPMPVVRSIAVENLFGRYSYTLDAPLVGGHVSRLMILHGDNGSGKTTLLNLAWDLLSTAELKGHKSRIAKTPFSKFSIDFEDGRRVEVRRPPDALVGEFDIATSGVRSSGETAATFLVNDNLDVAPTPGYARKGRTWELVTDGARGRAVRRIPTAGEMALPNDEKAANVRQVMSFLEDLQVEPVLLADDRELHSDQSDSSRESDRDDISPNERIVEELKHSINRVNRFLRGKTLSGQRLGSSEEASIYLNVLKQIRNYGAHSDPSRASERVEETINELAGLAPGLAEFELITGFDPHVIRQSVGSVGPDNRAIADAIILPYLESMRARFNALTGAQRVIRVLTTHANRYLRDKRLVYSPQPGLQVITDEIEPRILRPVNLSSGERQMLLLLCNALMAGVDRTLFLIDEPELSLGVPWQRQILSSLLDLTDGTDVQFIVATHSIEMVTANRPFLVKLVNQVG